jgi:hypothetical protein
MLSNPNSEKNWMLTQSLVIWMILLATEILLHQRRALVPQCPLFRAESWSSHSTRTSMQMAAAVACRVTTTIRWGRISPICLWSTTVRDGIIGGLALCWLLALGFFFNAVAFIHGGRGYLGRKAVWWRPRLLAWAKRLDCTLIDQQWDVWWAFGCYGRWDVYLRTQDDDPVSQDLFICWNAHEISDAHSRLLRILLIR